MSSATTSPQSSESGLFAGIFARCANKVQPAAEHGSCRGVGPVVPPKPAPHPVKELAVPPDPLKTVREIAQEARRFYEDYLREHGCPPTWESLMRNPRFAAAVRAENERIWRKAMEEIGIRRAKEREVHRPVAEEEVRNQEREAEPAERKARARELQKRSSAIYERWLSIANSNARAPEVPVADKYKGRDAVSRDEYMSALQGLDEERAMLEHHSKAMNEFESHYDATGSMLKQLAADRDANAKEVQALRNAYEKTQHTKCYFGYADALSELREVSVRVAEVEKRAGQERAERESFEAVEEKVSDQYEDLIEHPFLAADDAEGMIKDSQAVRQLVQVQNYRQARQVLEELAQRMGGATERAIKLAEKMSSERLKRLSGRINNVVERGSEHYRERAVKLVETVENLLVKPSLDRASMMCDALNDLEELLTEAETEIENEMFAIHTNEDLKGEIESILRVSKDKLSEGQVKAQPKLRKAWNRFCGAMKMGEWKSAAKAAIEVRGAFMGYGAAEKEASDKQRSKNANIKGKIDTAEQDHADACARGDMTFTSGLIQTIWKETKALGAGGGNGAVGGVYSMDQVQVLSGL